MFNNILSIIVSDRRYLCKTKSNYCKVYTYKKMPYTILKKKKDLMIESIKQSFYNDNIENQPAFFKK